MILRQAMFKRAGAAARSGDYPASAQWYARLWRHTGEPYFRVRMLEAHRLAGHLDILERELGACTVPQIIDSLSERHSLHLLRVRMGIDGRAAENVPPHLLGDQEIIEGLGRWWERSGEFPDVARTAVHVRTLPKQSIVVEGDGVIDEATPMPVSPLRVLHSDRPPIPTITQPATLTRLAGGWTELRDVYAAANSSAFVSADCVWVDEYRNEYPQISDPRRDPLVYAFTHDTCLTPDARALDERVTHRDGEGFWLAGRLATAWGHWITCYLSRVHYLRHHPLWGRLPLFIPEGLPSTFTEFLEYLAPGIPRVELAAGEVVQFSRVIVAPSRTCTPHKRRRAIDGPPEHAYAEPQQLGALSSELRSMTDQATQREWPAKVLASRGSNTSRSLRERESVNKLLFHEGFQEIVFEDLSAPDQVAIWTRCETIVGELGSWVFLAGLAGDPTSLILSSPRLDHWHGELSALADVRGAALPIVVGHPKIQDPLDVSDMAPHRPWELSARGRKAAVVAAVDSTDCISAARVKR